MRSFNWEIFVRVVGAFSPYAWPAVALAAALIFREELRKLLGRVTKGFGVELSPSATEVAAAQLPVPAEQQAIPELVDKPSTPALPPPTNTANAADHLAPAANVSASPFSAPSAQGDSPSNEEDDDDADTFSTASPEVKFVGFFNVFEQELRRFAEMKGVRHLQRPLRLVVRELKPHLTEDVREIVSVLIDTHSEVLLQGMKIEPSLAKKVIRRARLMASYFRLENARYKLGRKT